MSSYGEKNIRKLLKEVFDLYASVSDLVFTTYNFEPDFFEEHIITYLMGSDKKISTIGELNETNNWIKDHGVCVYYDKGALISGSSCVTLPVYPQHISTGVFHPKVVVVCGNLLNGNQLAHLIVSSCNLTVSGYGRNQEAFSVIQIKSDQVAKSLLDFLNVLCDGDYERHKSLKDYLRWGQFNSTKNVEFFWNYGNTGISLASRFSQMPDGKINIISPYFDEKGPESLLGEITEKDDVCIMPSIDGNGYNIQYSHYKELKDKGVSFGELERNTGADGSKRFIHAKLISKGNYVCVGSYNFTSAAMLRNNAEAALIFKLDEEPDFSPNKVDESLFLSEDETVVNKDEISISLDKIFVSVTVDWAQDKMLIYSEIPADQHEYRLLIDGMKNHSGWPIVNTINAESRSINLDSIAIKVLLRHKQFTVYEDNTACFKGLINEINWVGIRPEIGCESLDETIAEWFQYTNKKNNDHVYDLRCITEEDAITKQLIGGNVDPAIDVFDNYYLVSRALGFLLKEIQDNVEESQKVCPVVRKTKSYWQWNTTVQKAEEVLYGILFAWPGSMTQILSFVEKDEQASDKKQDVVYAWLICKYLKEAMKIMPKELDRILLFVEKRKDLTKVLNKAEKRYREKISKEVSDEYLNWIEKELFKHEVK